MTYWLYQMSINSPNGWSHDDYQKAVCERNVTTRGVWRIQPKDLKPQKGDMIVLFFAWSGDPKGGICGWGEVMGYDEDEKNIDILPIKPSDYLKMNPILNAKVKDITKRIRRVFRGNMWKIEPDLLKPIRQMVEQLS